MPCRLLEPFWRLALLLVALQARRDDDDQLQTMPCPPVTDVKNAGVV
jgi:hypothetical protein